MATNVAELFPLSLTLPREEHHINRDSKEGEQLQLPEKKKKGLTEEIDRVGQKQE